MSEYLVELFSQVMNVDHKKAQQILDVLEKVELVDREAIERWERGAAVYKLRGDGLSAPIIAARFCMARSKVFLAIKDHARRRRAALQFVA
jgi:hypothetical protein